MPRPLAGRIEAVIDAPEYKHARWGVLAVDAATGKTVYARNADQLFAPASVTKLYSCAAALVALGADHRFETPVYRRGTLTSGVARRRPDPRRLGRPDARRPDRQRRQDGLQGPRPHLRQPRQQSTAELTDTDPLAGLKTWPARCKARASSAITGDVLIDDRLFEPATRHRQRAGPAHAHPRQRQRRRRHRHARRQGRRRRDVTLRPATDFLQIDVQVETVAQRGRPQIRVAARRPAAVHASGAVCRSASTPVVRICLVDDPAGFARALFIDALPQAGRRGRGQRAASRPRRSCPRRTATPSCRASPLHARRRCPSRSR